MGLKAKLITSGIIGLILLSLCAVIYYQYQQNNQLITDKTAATQLAEQRRLSIDALEQNQASQNAAITALAKSNNALRSQYSQREQLIRSLENENETYRQWANTPLPESVKRLRTRPHITGSSEYRQWLSNANALRPDSDKPSPNR
jgi:LysB family phage lysis regulatory protein